MFFVILCLAATILPGNIKSNSDTGCSNGETPGTESSNITWPAANKKTLKFIFKKKIELGEMIVYLRAQENPWQNFIKIHLKQTKPYVQRHVSSKWATDPQKFNAVRFTDVNELVIVKTKRYSDGKRFDYKVTVNRRSNAKIDGTEYTFIQIKGISNINFCYKFIE